MNLFVCSLMSTEAKVEYEEMMKGFRTKDKILAVSEIVSNPEGTESRYLAVGFDESRQTYYLYVISTEWGQVITGAKGDAPLAEMAETMTEDTLLALVEV